MVSGRWILFGGGFTVSFDRWVDAVFSFQSSTKESLTKGLVFSSLSHELRSEGDTPIIPHVFHLGQSPTFTQSDT